MAKLSIKVPFNQAIKPKERVKIADAILTHIVGRTMAGYDKNNDKFAKYTKKYADIKGVGVSEVDLILSGEMLTELKVLNITPTSVEIGYKGSKNLIGKAEGNILGTYGQPDPIPGKARDFLGVLKDDVEIIIDSYLSEDLKGITADELDAIARQAAQEILGNIEFDTDIEDV